MIWAHKSLQARQIPLLHSDITAVLFQLGKRTILAFSIIYHAVQGVGNLIIIVY